MSRQIIIYVSKLIFSVAKIRNDFVFLAVLRINCAYFFNYAQEKSPVSIVEHSFLADKNLDHLCG